MHTQNILNIIKISLTIKSNKHTLDIYKVRFYIRAAPYVMFRGIRQRSSPLGFAVKCRQTKKHSDQANRMNIIVS